MKVTDEVFQVGGGDLSSPDDAAVYLISFGTRAALVDAGCGNSMEKIAANIRSVGVPLDTIDYLLLTHCHYDHTGGAEAMRQLTGCRIIAHELDARFLEDGDDLATAASWYGARMDPLTLDLKLAGPREEIDLCGRTIEAIHTPGHSPGSVVYLTESEGLRILFAQDVHGPLHPSLHSDREDYLRSLNLLLWLEADVLCEGHYGVYRGREEVEKFIRRFLA